MRCGGLGICTDGIQFNKHDDLAVYVEGEFETIFIEAVNGSKVTLIGNIYRVPSTNAKSSLERLGSIFERLSASKAKVIVVGDLNFDLLNQLPQNHFRDAKSCIHCRINTMRNQKPTRVTHHSTATLIDNIYVGNYKKYFITSGVTLSYIRSPFSLSCSKELPVNKKKPATFIVANLPNPQYTM